jgi:S1-C subfamily serine protease
MTPKTFVPVALVAAVAGGAGGAAIATGVSGGGKTTTVIQQAPLAASASSMPASANSSTGLTARQIYERDAPGVVFVRADIVQRSQSPFDLFPTEQRGSATGSGFVIDKSGDILTNAHVIDGAVKVTVQFANDKTVTAKVVGKDTSSDIALLKVEPDGLSLKPLSLGSAKDVHVGDPTVAIGNPFGLDRTLTTGVVSALQRRITAPNGFGIDDVIQTDAALNPGNSGGPLLDAAGRVIGINSQIETGAGGSQGSVGIGFAVPIDTAKRILPDLKSSGTVQHAFLGLTSVTVDSSLQRLGLSVSKGVLVQSVQSGSPADKAGLRGGDVSAQVGPGDIQLGGDVITKVDGKDIAGTDDLASAIQSHKPGDSVKVTYVRQGKEKTVDVTLGKQPQRASQQG